MAIMFPTAPTDGDIYTYEGTDYRYDNENGNNRWIAEQSGGASVTVSQDRPDPATAGRGDLWWYCGDGPGGVEDPGLFTLVIDTLGNQQWVQSSPSALLAGSTSGGGGSGLTSGFPISPPDSTGSFTFTGGGLTGTGMGQVLYGHIVPGSNIGSVGITTNTTGTAWVQSGTTRDQSVASSASFIAFIGLDDVISCGNTGFEADYAAWDVVEDTSGGGGTTVVNIGGGLSFNPLPRAAGAIGNLEVVNMRSGAITFTSAGFAATTAFGLYGDEGMDTMIIADYFGVVRNDSWLQLGNSSSTDGTFQIISSSDLSTTGTSVIKTGPDANGFYTYEATVPANTADFGFLFWGDSNNRFENVTVRWSAGIRLHSRPNSGRSIHFGQNGGTSDTGIRGWYQGDVGLTV